LQKSALQRFFVVHFRRRERQNAAHQNREETFQGHNLPTDQPHTLAYVLYRLV
jgi:hypothetical protein